MEETSTGRGIHKDPCPGLRKLPDMMDRHYGIKIGAKNYYLCVVLDRASREVLGRSLSDNIGVERFWRTYKHDCFLLNEVNSLEEAQRLTASWLTYYNQERPHARLGNLSPSEYYRQKGYPPVANFLRDFSASIQLALLRSAPSLRSGRSIYATKSRQKWIDSPHCFML